MPEQRRSGKRPNIPAAIRREVLREGSCAYCGESFFSLTIDHIVPFSRGGGDGRKNLTAACGPCNKEKLDFTPDEWKAWRIEMGHPWPPTSRSAFIAETVRKHWPQYLAEKAAEEAALSNQGEGTQS
jgi:hypothetical protein